MHNNIHILSIFGSSDANKYSETLHLASAPRNINEAYQSKQVEPYGILAILPYFNMKGIFHEGEE